MKCTHCGHEITGNAQFCGICGQKVEQPQQPSFNPPPAQPQQWQQPIAQGYQGAGRQPVAKPKKKYVAVLGGILIIVGLFFMFNTEEFDKKGTDYESAFLLGGEDASDMASANFYYTLEEFGEKGSMPCIILGGILFGVSFLIKEKNE